MARRDDGERNYVIVGRTDFRGPDRFNYKLGLRRAKSVQRVLRRAGIPKSRIEVISKGEEDAGRTRLWRDRRADVEPTP
jgi:outer membrane protein OmpA-like peptidoglycan-associated protein